MTKQIQTCGDYNKEDSLPENKDTWNSFWEENYYPEEYDRAIEEREYYEPTMPPQKDIVKSWILPVDDEGVITLPEDLLERTGWKEGDTLVYEISDGGVIVRKKELMNYNEMVAAGYTMTDDGFWILSPDAC